ncbi:Uncharacterised protein [Mycobacterium tuberculosis]|nr:Uncharacterised protein [Mycobacterium tuberculosis]CNU97309.1 Uncharacterised protein [Mycobacterium tuberculosis]SGO79229.1 Uncharacterised protein [Mycobacterium tuberculosis]
MRDVIAPRPAGEGQAPGDGQRAGRIVGVQAEFDCGDLDSGGKARIQVDVFDVIEPQPSQFQRPGTGDPNGRRPMQSVAVGDGRCVVGVGASLWINPAFGRYSQTCRTFDRRQQQRGTLVNHVVGVHKLGVGPADHPVLWAGLPDLVSRNRVADPRVRVVSSYGTEPRPQLADPLSVVLDRLAVGDAQRLLEYRVHVGRPVQVDPQLSRTGHRNVVAGHVRQRNGFVLHSPLQFAALGAQARSGAPGFGASQQHHAGPPALDVQACPVDQGLRHVAAHPAVTGGEGPRLDSFAEELPGIPVMRRQHVHHTDRIHRLEHRRIRGFPGRGGHQVDGFDGLLLGVDVASVVDLSIADQHWRPGVYRHGLNLARRRCGSWNGPRRSRAIGPSAATPNRSSRPGSGTRRGTAGLRVEKL